jgi:hypothetical protein
MVAHGPVSAGRYGVSCSPSRARAQRLVAIIHDSLTRLRLICAEMNPMSNAFDAFAELEIAVHLASLHFLRVELEVGNAMLDAATDIHAEDVRARRRARAQEAADEVAHQLRRGAKLRLTRSERADVTAGLARLKARLDAAA